MDISLKLSSCLRGYLVGPQAWSRLLARTAQRESLLDVRSLLVERGELAVVDLLCGRRTRQQSKLMSRQSGEHGIVVWVV
jgi:hypothetical protein